MQGKTKKLKMTKDEKENDIVEKIEVEAGIFDSEKQSEMSRREKTPSNSSAVRDYMKGHKAKLIEQDDHKPEYSLEELEEAKKEGEKIRRLTELAQEIAVLRFENAAYKDHCQKQIIKIFGLERENGRLKNKLKGFPANTNIPS